LGFRDMAFPRGTWCMRQLHGALVSS
jgi:hypothetical protein